MYLLNAKWCPLNPNRFEVSKGVSKRPLPSLIMPLCLAKRLIHLKVNPLQSINFNLSVPRSPPNVSDESSLRASLQPTGVKQPNVVIAYGW